MTNLMQRRREMLGIDSGNKIIYQASNLVFTGSNYIDTGVYLFSASNISRDFRITVLGLTPNNSAGSGSNLRAIIGSMLEIGPYPGFLVRAYNSAGASTGVIDVMNGVSNDLVIERKNGVFTVSGARVVGQIKSSSFDVPVTLGCELNSSGNPYRYMAGSIDSIVIEWL